MTGIMQRIALAATVQVGLMVGVAAYARAESVPDGNALTSPEERPWSTSYNDLGGTGLMQMPSARMHADGEFAAGMSHVLPYYRYYATLQVLPWLETTFRYTQIQNRLYGPVEFSGDQQYKDRGFDVKLRLLREGPENPELAVGLRDIGGTGLFSSEYLVASRRFYDFDFSLGMAWGNAGTRDNIPNPLGYLSSRFDTRPVSTTTGQFNPSFFRGNTALFGGVEWQTPVEGVRLKLEYDGNSYQSEPLGNQFQVDSPLNFAVEYAPVPWIELALAAERGNQVMLRASLHSNLNTEKGIPRTDAPPQPKPRPAPEAIPAVPAPTTPAAPAKPAVQEQAPVDSAALVALAERWGFSLMDASEDGDQLRLDVRDAGPLGDPVPLAEFALEASRAAPWVKTVVTIVAHDAEGPVAQTVLIRDDLERSKALTNLASTLGENGCCAWMALDKAGPRGQAFLDRLSHREAPLAREDSPKPANADEPLPANVQAKLAEKIFEDLRQQGMRGYNFSATRTRATLHLANLKYLRESAMIGRAAQIVANHAPASVEEIRLVFVEQEIAVSSFSLMRADLERMQAKKGSRQEVYQHAAYGEPEDPADNSVRNPEALPRFEWGVAPQLRQHVGGPDNFYFFQVYADIGGRVLLPHGFSVGGSVGQDLYNNFEGLELASDSKLPHVRSDVKDYLKGSPTWIDTAYVNYQARLGADFYGRVTAGILELMYMGVASELLYYPQGASWAVGLDMERVRQRDFDGGFGTRPYEATTGHLSLYHRLPFWNLSGGISVGRYLAGDTGVTVQLGRRFESGFAVSAFATKTNVSSEQFGEGSFDKGFMISIPMDLFTGQHSRTYGNFAFRPLTRDGGQKVSSPVSLFPTVDAHQQYRADESWDYFGR